VSGTLAVTGQAGTRPTRGLPAEDADWPLERARRLRGGWRRSRARLPGAGVRPLARGVLAASMVVLVATLYFTFSRDARLAGFAGLVVLFALEAPLRPRQVPAPRPHARHQTANRTPANSTWLRARLRTLGRRTHLLPGSTNAASDSFRNDRQDDIHKSFPALACFLISWRQLEKGARALPGALKPLGDFGAERIQPLRLRERAAACRAGARRSQVVPELPVARILCDRRPKVAPCRRKLIGDGADEGDGEGRPRVSVAGTLREIGHVTGSRDCRRPRRAPAESRASRRD
jgi:hypothetical protein